MRRSGLHAGVIIVSICLLWGGLAAGAVLGTGVFAGGDNVSSIGTDDQVSGLTGVTGPAQQADNTTANDTDRHRNPDEYSEDGDSEQVSSWLTNRLAGLVGDSVINLSEDQYEFARQFVGDEFETRVGQLVDVDGNTDDDTDDTDDDSDDTNTAALFNQTKTEQEQLITDVEEYRETKTAYENALAANDTQQARTIARELTTIADRVESQSITVERLLNRIANVSDRNLSTEIETIAELRQEILSDVATLRESIFISTELTVTPAQANISFLDPLTATGQLRTADDEPIANEVIELSVGQTTIEAETDATGTVTFSYRPTRLPLNTSALSISYQPAPESIYSESNTTVAINVTQVTPTIANVTSLTNLAYTETSTISGTLTVNETPVDGVTVNVSLAGTQLDTATVQNGQFETTVALPAAVPVGTQTLQLTLPDRQRAVGGTETTQSVEVQETPTGLSLEATPVDAESVNVTGNLIAITGVGESGQTTDVRGVSGQLVQLRVDDITLDTVTTAQDGTFRTQIDVSQVATGGETVTIEARYVRDTTNLESAVSSTTVSLPTSSSEGTGTGTNEDTTGQDRAEDRNEDTTGQDRAEDRNEDTTGQDRAEDSSIIQTIAEESGIIQIIIAGLVVAATGVAGLWWLRRRYNWTRPTIGGISRLSALFEQNAQNTDNSSDGGSVPTEQHSAAETSVPVGPTEATLAYAHQQLATGQTDQAAEAAYIAVRESLGETIGTVRPLTHWEFYHKYRTTISEDDPPDATTTVERLRAITGAYERAKFSQQTTPAETAQLVLDQAYRVLDIDQPASGGDTTTQTDD